MHAPHPSCCAASLPQHLAAPPPRQGFQRRPLHFTATPAKNAAGSLWERPPPGRQAADPGAAICVDALDSLFAKPLLGAASAGSSSGSGSGSSSGSGSGAAASQHAGSGSGTELPAGCDGDGSMSVGSPGRALSKRPPAVSFFTGGRKAVNIEILLCKLGSPAEVAQAIAELDAAHLPVSSLPDCKLGAPVGRRNAEITATRCAPLLSCTTQVEMLRELQANLPDDAELAALHRYLDRGGDPGQLGRAEQLFVALRGIPRLQQKLQ